MSEYNKEVLLQRALVYIYLIVIFGVYPVITTNKYYNITITKYNCFMWSSIIYSVLTILIFLLVNINKKTISAENIRGYTKGRFYQRPEFWMEAFMLANVFSYFVSIDKKASLMGAGVRYMGMVTYIVIAVVFLIIASIRICISEWIFMVFAASVVYGELVAVLQHMGADFMKYREGILPKLYDIYISTFGNINIYASFLAMCLPVFAALHIFSKSKVCIMISAIVLILGGNSLMAANSDSGFLGVFAALVMLFFIAVSDKRITGYIRTVFLIFCGILVQAVLNRIILDYDNKRGGVAGFLDKLPVTIGIFSALVLIMVSAAFAQNKLKEKKLCADGKRLAGFLARIMGIVLALFLITGKMTGLSIFNIDYRWGTYRGMIWHISLELFQRASGVHRLFGYGNETLGILAKADYYDIMINNTKRVYDNAHNELLQYLVTIGIIGLVAYIGLFVCCFVYIFKNAGKNAMAYACLAAMTGYFIQSLINVNQPITTPFLFIFMAMGINVVRNHNKGEIIDE